MQVALGDAKKKPLVVENCASAGLLGVIDVGKINISSLDEGIFPEEVLDEIEKKREKILGRIRGVAEKEEKGALGKKEERARSVEEVKRTLQMLVFEIEKLQAQTGTRCVAECTRIMQEVERIQKKIEQRKRSVYFSYGWGALLAICASFIMYVVLQQTR